MTAGDETADGRGDDADAVDSDETPPDAAESDDSTDAAGGERPTGEAVGGEVTDTGGGGGGTDTGLDAQRRTESDVDRREIEGDADPVPLGEPQTLDPAVRTYWMVRSVIRAVTLAVVALLFATVLDQTVLPLPVRTVTAVVFALLVALGVARSVLRYRSWAYAVREESLFLSRGVFTQVQTVVPYVRVQHIDTRRGAVERLFGLSSLVVYTAGSRGADVTIPGLTPGRASSLQTRLKRLAIESEEEDAV